MSEPVPPAEPVADPGERGRLVLADRVVQRIAERAALDAPGVVRRASGVQRLAGRGLPRAQTTVAGQRTRIALDVAVRWPASLAGTAATVRAVVATRVHELTALTVDAVDVSITDVVATGHAVPERRVQ